MPLIEKTFHFVFADTDARCSDKNTAQKIERERERKKANEIIIRFV